MRLNQDRFSINMICLFSQIMWFYVMGLTTPFQIRSIQSDRTEIIDLLR